MSTPWHVGQGRREAVFSLRTAYFLGAARVHHLGEAGPRTIRFVLDHDLPRAAQVKGGEQQENRALPTSTFLVEFRGGRGMEPGVPAIAWTESNRPRTLTFASLITCDDLGLKHRDYVTILPTTPGESAYPRHTIANANKP